MDTVIKSTDDIPVGLPVLLRTARKTYSWAIRKSLNEAGFEGIPHNGVYILLGIARGSFSVGQLIKEQNLAKQAASHLIETLVANGYVVRTPNPADRRQNNLELTDLGRQATQVAGQAVDKINHELLEEVGADNERITKYVLAVLIDINDRHNNLPRGIR